MCRWCKCADVEIGKGTAGQQDTTLKDGFLETSQSCTIALEEEDQQMKYSYVLVSKTHQKKGKVR